jgi:ATP-dependent protease ClpP protease subunit
MDLFILEDITQKLAKDVILDINKAKGESITAHIMTMGGDVLGGNAIAASLKNSPSHVTTNVIGVAASMGAVISQAGDHRLIAPDALFNVHNSAKHIVGRPTKEEHQDAIETLEKLDASMAKAFSRTGLSDDSLKTLLKSDTLLTAKEALTLGFFDGYSEPVEALAQLTVNIKEMSKLSELMGKVDLAAIKLGLKSTDDEAKKALVTALEAELKGEAEKQVIEKAAGAETGAEILGSEMVPRSEFEMFKAEIMALLGPMLGAVETLPTPEETATVVEETTEAKLDNLLRSIKSKTVAPDAKQTFEQPAEKEKENWDVYDARKAEIKENNKR